MQNPVTLNRSCENCRERKIKCLVPEEHQINERKCTRCEKHALECIFLPPIIRKRRKRNETKIKELEQKLRSIESAFSGEKDEGQLGTPKYPDGNSRSTLSPFTYTNVTEETPSQYVLLHYVAKDPVTCGLLNGDSAQGLVQKFCNELKPMYPLVALPADTKWDDLRNEKPGLFSAVLTAAAGSAEPKLFQTLFDYTSKHLAEEVVVHGHRSLELIQALLLMATWHHPAGKFQELKFSQFAHMAATMVSDLRSSNDASYVIPRSDRAGTPSELVVETCRTFIASYFMCSSISLTLRRQNHFQYGQWIEDCMNTLLRSSTPDLNDMRLTELVKLQRIVEEGFEVLGLDGSSAIDYSDAPTRYVLSNCVERVLKWRQSVPDELVTATISIHCNALLVSLYEPALHDGHDIMDFRPPYKLRSLPLVNLAYNDAPLDAVDALNHCITSAETIIHTFLSLSARTLRCVPVIIYARMAYAAVVLIKFDVSARDLSSPASLLQRKTASRSLLLQIIGKLDVAMGSERYQIPATFHNILSRTVIWYIERIDHLPPFMGESSDMIEPMRQLSINQSPRSERKSSEWSLQLASSRNSDECYMNIDGDEWSNPAPENIAFNFPEMFNDINITACRQMY